MIRIKEDISKIINEYRELEDNIISVCKKLNIIRKPCDYYGFIYDEELEQITVRVNNPINELESTIDYDFPITCLFSNYAINEQRKHITKLWNDSE